MIYILLILIGIAADQASKIYIAANLAMNENIPIIPNFFSITKLINRGAAWSFLDDTAWGIYLLTAISVVALMIMIVYLYRSKNEHLRYSLVLLIAGCTGNLLDRIIYKGVIDMLSFKFGTYQYPVFNIADILLVVGAFSLAFWLFKDKEFDNNDKNGNKKKVHIDY